MKSAPSGTANSPARIAPAGTNKSRTRHPLSITDSARRGAPRRESPLRAPLPRPPSPSSLKEALILLQHLIEDHEVALRLYRPERIEAGLFEQLRQVVVLVDLLVLGVDHRQRRLGDDRLGQVVGDHLLPFGRC